MQYFNYTPHKIVLNDGRSFKSNGVARVSASFTAFNGDVCRQTFGEVNGLPEPREGVTLIVSAMVLSASKRHDLVAPATGHPETVRNDQGHIVSVPGFVK
tara:strand:- start:159 stop:458 length:300 start_codon:yes stop_codon:yes gene_type:complete